MRKILLTTTAMVALGSVAAIAADVSISGNVRFRYNAWSDDITDAANSGNNNNEMAEMLFLSFKAAATTDSGLKLSTHSRMRGAGTLDQNNIGIAGDFGSLTLGKQWTIGDQYSLGENHMGTIAGGEYVEAAAGNVSYTAIMKNTAQYTSAKENKVVYQSPSINGFKAAVAFADKGETSKANSTAYAAQYTTAIGDGNLTLAFHQETEAHADSTNATADTEAGQMGVSYSNGMGRIWALQMTQTQTQNGGTKDSDQSGTNFGAMYNVSDSIKVIYYNITSEEDAGVNKLDTYDSDTIGFRYDIAGGLRVGVLHTTYDFTDKSTVANNMDGSASRIEVRMNF